MADTDAYSQEDAPGIDAGMDLIDDITRAGDGPLGIACPNRWCGSQPGERCVNMAHMRAGKFLPRQVPFHPARVQAAAAVSRPTEGGAHG